MPKIVNARVIVTCPGRNFVTLKIECDDGTTGVGDATLNGRELSVASYLTDHVVPCLIGREAHRIEDLWQYLYKGAYWRRGPVTMSAIAAVDTALWDIKGKLAGLPVYQLLGGASREGVMVYGHANGTMIEETIATASVYQAEGYRAIRLQCGVPGMASTYGVSKDRYFYEPADADLPTENVWSTEKYLRIVPELFKAARAALGWDVYLLHDVHHRLTPIEAGRLGKDLEPYRPFWLEDPTPADNQDAFRLIRQHTTTPIAVGEIFNSIWDAKDLIQKPVDRLYPRDRRPCRRHHPFAPHRRARRSLPDPDRLPWRDRPVAGLHGGGAAFRSLGAQFRRAGIYAAHARNRRGLPACVSVRSWDDASGRRARAGGRHRRGTRQRL